MLRSFLLMTHHRITSVPQWVQKTRSEPLLAILCGFPPDDTPGVGTYYDFIDRFIDGPYQKPCDHVVKPSAQRKRTYLRGLDHEALKKKQDTDPNQPQTEKLATELLENQAHQRLPTFHKLLEDLFFQLALIPSMEQGHLNLSQVTVSGDGSGLESHASPRPRPTCGCRAKGIFRCDCAKPYTSKTASWYWDEYRNAFYFGDRYYHLMTHQNGHDIPLISFLPGGTESDYTLSLKTFDRFVKASRENGVELKIAHFVGDGHHDSYAHYRYFGAKEVIPIIPLCESSKNGLLHIEGLSMADDGVPLCPGGIKMRHHQYDRAKQRHVYACPAKTGTHRNGQYQYVFRPELCPFKQDCAPHSPMAPWAYIPTRDNPRLFPPI
ncbi:MAG: hypothetical protein L0Y56_17895, partial [Nitrospira sp.]|nr:hypothetical protein [Nitrospira sp.]